MLQLSDIDSVGACALKRVYLDQNKWIDLAAAERGLRKGDPFQDAFLLLREAVTAGEVSLPLSRAHYVETGTRREWKSRRNLALNMLALSQLHTIAPIEAMIPPELDRALQGLTGRPRSVRQLRPFGVGASHAFAQDIPRQTISGRMVWRVAERWGIEADANRLGEIMLLVGPTPEEEAGTPDYNPLAHLEVGEKYAKDKEAMRTRRKAEGFHKGDRAKQLALDQAFWDHRDAISEALQRAQVSGSRIADLGNAGRTRFLEAVPTMWASAELERHRETASQRAWERQDLLDISALAVASVYCDIVITERSWVDAAQRSKLDQKLDTTFLSRLDELPAHIV